MDNKEKLINYYQELCRVLNENRFRFRMKMDGGISEMDFETDIETPQFTMTEITQNIEGYSFLKNKGLIRDDLCHFCGKSPIDETYTFTEPINYIKMSICRSCHSHGKSEQEILKNAIKPSAGCLLSLPVLFSIFITRIIILISY